MTDGVNEMIYALKFKFCILSFGKIWSEFDTLYRKLKKHIGQKVSSMKLLFKSSNYIWSDYIFNIFLPWLNVGLMPVYDPVFKAFYIEIRSFHLILAVDKCAV
jgi:hypothetical protein